MKKQNQRWYNLRTSLLSDPVYRALPGQIQAAFCNTGLKSSEQRAYGKVYLHMVHEARAVDCELSAEEIIARLTRDGFLRPCQGHWYIVGWEKGNGTSAQDEARRTRSRGRSQVYRDKKRSERCREVASFTPERVDLDYFRLPRSEHLFIPPATPRRGLSASAGLQAPPSRRDAGLHLGPITCLAGAERHAVTERDAPPFVTPPVTLNTPPCDPRIMHFKASKRGNITMPRHAVTPSRVVTDAAGSLVRPLDAEGSPASKPSATAEAAWKKRKHNKIRSSATPRGRLRRRAQVRAPAAAANAIRASAGEIRMVAAQQLAGSGSGAMSAENLTSGESVDRSEGCIEWAGREVAKAPSLAEIDRVEDEIAEAERRQRERPAPEPPKSPPPAAEAPQEAAQEKQTSTEALAGPPRAPAVPEPSVRAQADEVVPMPPQPLPTAACSPPPALRQPTPAPSRPQSFSPGLSRVGSVMGGLMAQLAPMPAVHAPSPPPNSCSAQSRDAVSPPIAAPVCDTEQMLPDYDTPTPEEKAAAEKERQARIKRDREDAQDDALTGQAKAKAFRQYLCGFLCAYKPQGGTVPQETVQVWGDKLEAYPLSAIRKGMSHLMKNPQTNFTANLPILAAQVKKHAYDAEVRRTSSAARAPKDTFERQTCTISKVTDAPEPPEEYRNGSEWSRTSDPGHRKSFDDYINFHMAKEDRKGRGGGVKWMNNFLFSHVPFKRRDSESSSSCSSTDTLTVEAGHREQCDAPGG